jgi:uncharacterized membrane protein YkvI
VQKNELNFLIIAFVYVGTIMGAGFASGREIWQFFGVFGKVGYMGIGFVTVMFMIVGFMTSRIARLKNTNDIGKIVAPSDNRFFISFIGWLMGAELLIALIYMSAAGGALFKQQFGLSSFAGGAVVVIFVAISVMGGLDRVSNIFRFIVPVLMTIVIITCILVVFGRGFVVATETAFEPSPLAGSWPVAAILFLAFNALGVIPIIASAAKHAKSEKHAYSGSIIGGLLLGALALLLLGTMMTDMDFSGSKDMPMLAFSEKLSPFLNLLYSIILFFAIYSCATSNFYGFTLRMIKGSHRNLKIIASAGICFVLGLMGFTTIIEYVLPIDGYFGIVIVLMLIVNYIKTELKHRHKIKE